MGSNTLLGRAGEQVAVRHLEAQGIEVLARNWRPTGAGLRGEIDIVARDGPVLVVCEVKARRGRAPAGRSRPSPPASWRSCAPWPPPTWPRAAPVPPRSAST